MTLEFSRRSTLKALGGSSAALSLAGCIGEGGDDVTTLILGTASESTGAYALSQAIAAVVNENSDILRIDAIPTAGSAQSPQLVDQGEIDIGYSDRAHLYRIHNDMEQFEDDPFENELVHLFYYYSVQMGVIGREGTVEELSDCQEARGSPNVEGAASRDALLNHMKYGIDVENANLTSVDYGDLASQMGANQIDWCGEVRLNQRIVPSYMQELWSTVDDAVLVHWPEDVVEEAMNDPLNDGFMASPDDLETDYARFGDYDEAYFPEIIYDAVCQPDVDDELINELLTQMVDNADAMAEYHSLGEDFDTDGEYMSNLDTETYPTHSAAENYYSEIGAGSF